MQRTGRKTTVRIWPEAQAALRTLKDQFRAIDRYGKNEALISSAILLLAEQSGAGLVNSGGRWRPMSQLEAEALKGTYLHATREQTASSPALRLV